MFGTLVLLHTTIHGKPFIWVRKVDLIAAVRSDPNALAVRVDSI